jgi:hypothetical protein
MLKANHANTYDMVIIGLAKLLYSFFENTRRN